MRPYILLESRASLFNEEASLGLGLTAITVILLDLYGFRSKLKEIKQEHTAEVLKKKLKMTPLLLLWFGHFSVNMLFTNFAVQLFSNINDINPSLVGFIGFLVIIKELVLLHLIFDLKKDKKKTEENKKDSILADFAIAISSSFGYITIVENLSIRAISPSNLEEWSFQIAAALGLFLLFFIPLRLPYLIKEKLEKKSGKERAYWWASFITATLLAISPYLI